MRPSTERIIAVLCTPILLLVFWSAATATPSYTWNGARFYPAYLLAAGEPLYHLEGEGVTNGWIYGPVLPLLLAPFSLISDPTWAMVAAGWFNILVLILPMVLVVDAVIGKSFLLRRRWLLGLSVAGVVMIVPTTAPRLVFITCDQLAIGFSLVSCFLLYRAEKILDWRSLLAAVFTGLALWTKQTEVFLPLGQIVFLIVMRSVRSAIRYVCCLVVVQGVLLLLIGWACGWKELWLNLVWIPTHHPLAPGEYGLVPRMIRIIAYVTPFLVACLWKLRRYRDGVEREKDTGDTLAIQLLIVGFFLIPPGLLAAAKTGGEENSFHFVYFFVLAALISARNAIVWICEQPECLAVVAMVCLSVAGWWVRYYAPIRFSPALQLRSSIILAEQMPGQVFFPRNPLVTWISERKKYHLEYGVFDRSLAGLSLSRKEFLGGVPARLRRVVYPAPGDFFLMQLFPGLKLESQLPDFVIYAVEQSGVEGSNPSQLK